jgi:hypothetical protein
VRDHQKDFGYLTQLLRARMKRTASQTQKIWMETIQAGIDEGRFVKDLDPVIVYRFMRDSIWMSAWQQPTGRYSVDEVADECCAVPDGFLHASMRARSGPSSTSVPTTCLTRCSESTSTVAD